MWSYCSSLVSAAESLHCIRISALLLNVEGSGEFRPGSEQCCARRILCAHFAISDSSAGSQGRAAGLPSDFNQGMVPAPPGTPDPAQPQLSDQRQGMHSSAWAAGAALGTLCSLKCILIFSFPWTCGDAEWAAFIYWIPGGIWEWAALRSCWCLVGNLWNKFCLELILYVPHSIFSVSLFFCTRILMREVVAFLGARFPLLSHLRLNFHV